MFTVDNINTLANTATELASLIQAVAAIEDRVQPQDAWCIQSMTDLLEQDSINMFIVYDKNGKKEAAQYKVIGYCLYQVVFEQSEILRIGTHPDYQRQGVATHMFTELNTVLKQNKVAHLMLEVRADNKAAIALYERQGFSIIHQRKNYYQLPEQAAVDALVMQLMYP